MISDVLVFSRSVLSRKRNSQLCSFLPPEKTLGITEFDVLFYFHDITAPNDGFAQKIGSTINDLFSTASLFSTV